MRQTLLFDFSTSTHFTLEASNIQYNSRGNPKTGRGRAPSYLTAKELEEIVQQYYFSSSQEEKQRVLQRFGKRKIKHALAICKLDIGKQSKIGRQVCSFHGAEYLVYNWCGASGVRIRCFPPGGCSFNTHYDSYLFQGGEKQFDESSEM